MAARLEAMSPSLCVSVVRMNTPQGIDWATPAALSSEEGRAKTLAAIERVHRPEYLDEVRRVCARGGGAADFDT